MTTAVAEKLYTPEDLLTLNGDRNYELLDGRLVEKPMGAEASRITARILGRLEQHADTHQQGFLFDAECGYYLIPNRNRVRKPDGSFVRRGRLPNDRPPKGHIRIAPDLTLETVSPNDLADEVEEKIEEFLTAGVLLVWVVFPTTQRVMVYRADGTVSRLGPHDELSGEDVLPGFSLRVETIFAGLQLEPGA